MKFKYFNKNTQTLYLSFLPNISKWNTNKVTDISFMFYNCSSLKLLPDISKWKLIILLI